MIINFSEQDTTIKVEETVGKKYKYANVPLYGGENKISYSINSVAKYANVDFSEGAKTTVDAAKHYCVEIKNITDTTYDFYWYGPDAHILIYHDNELLADLGGAIDMGDYKVEVEKTYKEYVDNKLSDVLSVEGDPKWLADKPLYAKLTDIPDTSSLATKSEISVSVAGASYQIEEWTNLTDYWWYDETPTIILCKCNGGNGVTDTLGYSIELILDNTDRTYEYDGKTYNYKIVYDYDNQYIQVYKLELPFVNVANAVGYYDNLYSITVDGLNSLYNIFNSDQDDYREIKTIAGTSTTQTWKQYVDGLVGSANTTLANILGDE